MNEFSSLVKLIIGDSLPAVLIDYIYDLSCEFKENLKTKINWWYKFCWMLITAIGLRLVAKSQLILKLDKLKAGINESKSKWHPRIKHWDFSLLVALLALLLSVRMHFAVLFQFLCATEVLIAVDAEMNFFVCFYMPI